MVCFPPLDVLAWLLAIDPDDPADADDLEVLRQLLARRTRAGERAGGPAPSPGPLAVRDGS